MMKETYFSEIQKLNLAISPIQMGKGLVAYEHILKSNFAQVESCFIKLTFPTDKKSLWPTSLVKVPKETSFATSTENFLTSLFRNPNLLNTPLKQAGIGEDFKLKSEFVNIPFLTLDGYLATVISYPGWYGQNEIDPIDAKKIGSEIISEIFGSPGYQYQCFFNDFKIWSDNFDSWDVMFTFIVFNNNDKTITLLHTNAQQG